MEDLARIGIPPNKFMPELPEVETIKNVLLKIVVGQTIVKVDVLRDSTIVGDKKLFIDTLTNKTFLDVTRIGKFLIFHLSDEVVFISHLRMEGKYFEVSEEKRNTPFARVVFHLNNGHKLCYDDSRCFGMMKLSNEKGYLSLPDINKLGPEPFKVKDVDYLLDRCKKNTGPIKSTLLDQTLMTGLGNIYVDETLFASKIHPLTPTNLITRKQWEIILKNAQEILTSAIKEGGSTIKSYHPGKGIDGGFQTSLKAYGKADEPCPRCGKIMRFIKVGGRGTTFCPKCQIRKSSKLLVALYGKISSGKSTILNIFKNHGAHVISSDEIVHNLYNHEKVINEINKQFGFSFIESIGREELRKHLLDNPKDITKLNNLIHPLVKEKIISFNKDYKKGILVVEVPLLYESKMNDMFDYIIAVDIDPKEQFKRLSQRNSITAKDLEIINSCHKFSQNKDKADTIIVNNGSLTELENQVVNIINILKDRLN